MYCSIVYLLITANIMINIMLCDLVAKHPFFLTLYEKDRLNDAHYYMYIQVLNV